MHNVRDQYALFPARQPYDGYIIRASEYQHAHYLARYHGHWKHIFALCIHIANHPRACIASPLGKPMLSTYCPCNYKLTGIGTRRA
jgi:hypothetical protein